MNEKTEPENKDHPTGLTPEVLVPRLGEYLIERGLITEEQLTRVIAIQKMYQSEWKDRAYRPDPGERENDLQADLDRAVTEQILQLRTALQNANASLELRVKERTAEVGSRPDQTGRFEPDENQYCGEYFPRIAHTYDAYQGVS